MRPQVARILRDMNHEDEDINTYAAMNILRLKQITEDELEAILPALRTSTSHASISVRFFSKKALNEVKLQMAKFPHFKETQDKIDVAPVATRVPTSFAKRQHGLPARDN